MDKAYFISQGETTEQQLQCITAVCGAGGHLIQLRMKEIEETVFLKTAEKAKVICDAFDAQLIINDSISVAKTIGAAGVHLGKHDANPTEARELLGNNCIIGATANTLEDCLRLSKTPIDYIGLGPFKFTETKKNLDPILGFEGYQTICQVLKQQNIELPVYAIGGITTANIPQLTETGIYGIALSGALVKKSAEEIKKTLGLCRANLETKVS